MRYDFFKTKNNSEIANSGGPSKPEQLAAIHEKRYWTVLNSKLLNSCKKNYGNDQRLLHEVNAIKAALQTYGPYDNKIPGLVNNSCNKTKGIIFHAHASDTSATMHIVEWEVIDKEKRILAIVGFASHENYSFKKRPFKPEEKEALLNTSENISIFNRVKENKEHVDKKVKQTNKIHGII